MTRPVDTSNVRNRIATRTPTAPSPAPAVPKAELELLEKLRKGIARALPQSAAFTPDRFLRIVLTEFRRQPALLECSEASLMAGIMLSAQLGLEIGGPLGHSYLIPFRSGKGRQPEATWILGYKGIIQLAHRSGMLSSIEARDVRANDEFSYSYGLDEHLHHVPAESKRGPLTHVYTIARFTGGGRWWAVLTRAEVDEHRDRSKSGMNGPWVTDYEAMARKTAIRVAAPYLPLSPEIARAVIQDEQVLSVDDDDVIDLVPHGDPAELVEAADQPAEPVPGPSEDELIAAANEAFDAGTGS